MCFSIKRAAVVTDFLKASAATALKQCESCNQNKNIYIKKSECVAEIVKEPQTTSGTNPRLSSPGVGT